ncbi:tyrosine-type recombinase/integrase [Paenarthrobacter nicotinovorans]|uniref:tyrosine-type recombinase/integrase n=1 Tax=Paenarthrobacter nicotinovorans TaxID=29320 RepID=UPI0018D2C5FD|nr:tyrosine-type recombinase/integrase [Paenarthrobacter nicotinovorans]
MKTASDESPWGTFPVKNGFEPVVLVPDIAYLNEEETVFKAMLTAWKAQRLGGRNLRPKTVASGVQIVRRFRDSCGELPWEWSAALFDEWMEDLVAVRRLAPSTIRHYQNVTSQFCDFLCSPHYGWVEECERRFGTHPVQVCTEWNTTRHLQDYEGNPRRRPLTRAELQTFFDYADQQVGVRLDSGRKGTFSAYRDATLFKVAYAWGLRAAEVAGLDVTDFYRNPHAPEFGSYGMVLVRNGKASRGGAPKRRCVATLHGWAADAVGDYIENIWPLVRMESSNALWVTERGARMSPVQVSMKFAEYREELSMDPVLSPHALRHSYVTHLVEDGVDPLFIQRQVGHVFQSTTAIYTSVSGEFANTMMRKAIAGVMQAAAAPEPVSERHG